jgi:hypothetical protein
MVACREYILTERRVVFMRTLPQELARLSRAVRRSDRAEPAFASYHSTSRLVDPGADRIGVAKPRRR